MSWLVGLMYPRVLIDIANALADDLADCFQPPTAGCEPEYQAVLTRLHHQFPSAPGVLGFQWLPPLR